MGRKFAGDAFMSTPAVVEFKDFEVGQTYSQKVVITNRSYEKNTYRVLQVRYQQRGRGRRLEPYLAGHIQITSQMLGVVVGARVHAWHEQRALMGSCGGWAS